MAKKRVPAPAPEAVAQDLEVALHSSRRTPSSWESAQGVHKRRFARALDDGEVAGSLAQDISTALAEQVDDLSTHHHEFKVGMVRVVSRVLRLAKARPERVALFNEAIPGFTLLLFKKDPDLALAPQAMPGRSDPPPGPEIAAAGQVIAQFVHRTGHRVLTVETNDVLFVFFPASDVKRNLKEMGFYYTD